MPIRPPVRGEPCSDLESSFGRGHSATWLCRARRVPGGSRGELTRDNREINNAVLFGSERAGIRGLLISILALEIIAYQSAVMH